MKKLLFTTALTVIFTASIANAAGVGVSVGGNAGVNTGSATVNSGVNANVGGNGNSGSNSVDANTRSTGSGSVDANTRSTGATSVDSNTRNTGGASLDTSATGGVTGGVIDAPTTIDSDVQSETRINGNNSGYVRSKPIVQKTRSDATTRAAIKNNGRSTVGPDGNLIVPASGNVR